MRARQTARSGAPRTAVRAPRAKACHQIGPPSNLRTDRSSRTPSLSLPPAECALAKQRDLALHELPCALLGPRRAIGDVAHHVRVGGDGAEFQPVVRFPVAEVQSFGFEPDTASTMGKYT